MLPRITYIIFGGALILFATLGLLAQRWAIHLEGRVDKHASDLSEERARNAGRLRANLPQQVSGSAEVATQHGTLPPSGTLQELLETERKEKAKIQRELEETKQSYSKDAATWATAQTEWHAWSKKYEEWAKSDADKYQKYCAISDIALGYDSRFFPKAAELRLRINSRQYPTFEELYLFVMNEKYDSKDNVWHHFPNAYNMVPSFVFPFSNLGEADIDNAFQKLARPPAFVVEVGSFHGHSAILMAKMLDKRGFGSTPLLCIDPWSGDLGELLFRDDWQKKLTPGEIRDGRSTSYYQFMTNVKSQIDTGKIAPKHIVPLAITSNVGARYLLALGLTPDIVYLDSAHEKDETFMEMSLYYSLLAKGGILFGDDFTWESVSHDVKKFAERNQLKLTLFGSTWILQKPLAEVPQAAAAVPEAAAAVPEFAVAVPQAAAALLDAEAPAVVLTLR